MPRVEHLEGFEAVGNRGQAVGSHLFTEGCSEFRLLQLSLASPSLCLFLGQPLNAFIIVAVFSPETHL